MAWSRSLARDIWDGIRSQPGRVGLSFFAVSIGVVALTVLVSVIDGLRMKSRMMIQELGVNVMVLMPPPQATMGARAVPLNDRVVTLLKANLPDCELSPVNRYEVPSPGTDRQLNVVATDDALARARQWTVREGRFLDARDVRCGQRHVVITRALSARWDWKLGAVILLQNTPFTVVGIMDMEEGALEAEGMDARLFLGERTVFVPRTASASWMRRGESAGADAVFVRVPEGREMSSVLQTAQRVMEGPGLALRDASWVTPETLIANIKRMQGAIKFSVGSIAILCLILGGTTLMSLMIANVRDRVVEIGLRRALGASSRDVALLFVVEACLITGVAALAGTVGACILLVLGREYVPAPLVIRAWTFLVPVIVSLGLGCLFSYGPARMAARISPAEALRNE